MTKIKLTLALLIFTHFVGAQSIANPNLDSLALDSSIRFGILPNGFSYYIKSLVQPQPKLFINLHVKVGSNLEGQDQIGIAHGLEHLAFKSTRNFPMRIRNNEVLEKAQMGIMDLGGSSGVRSTSYHLKIPENNNEVLDIGLLWFKDIADGLNFTEADITQVKGELRQEFLTKVEDKLNNYFTGTRLDAKLFPCLLDQSEIFEVNDSLEPETFRLLYEKWYRPELMAITVVGNIKDIDDLQKKIEKTFSGITARKKNIDSRSCEEEFYSRPAQFLVVERHPDTTRMLQDNTVNFKLVYREPGITPYLNTRAGILRLTSLQLLIEIVNKRLGEATEEYNSFETVAFDNYKYRELPPHMEISITSKDEQEESVLKETLRIIQQLQKFGITDHEWEQMKQERLTNFEFNGENNAEFWINEIKKHHILGEALPVNKKALLKEMIKDYSLLEFNRFVKEFLNKMPEDIGIITPKDHQAINYTEKEVRNWIKEVYNEPVKPYEVPVIPSQLMTKREKKALQEIKVKSKRKGKTGATEILLNNGVKLVINPHKPQQFGKKDKVIIDGFSLEGANCVPEKNYFAAINAPSIIWNSGINGLNKFELQRFLSTTSISWRNIFPYVDHREAGIQGEANLEDFEILLQLIYLSFTKPNKSEKAYEDWKAGVKSDFVNPQGFLVEGDFNEAIRKVTGDFTLNKTLGRSHLMGSTLYESIAKTDYEESHDLFKSLFGSANKFTFVVSGAFDPEKVFPLLNKYLGNLPNLVSNKPVKNCEEESFILPEGPIYQKISVPDYYQVKNIGYAVRYLEHTEKVNNWQEQLKIEALGRITDHLVWNLRFKENFSLYTVWVNGDFNKEMKRYEISSNLECVPEEFPLIRKDFHKIISNIKTGKLTEDLFSTGMKRMYNSYDKKTTSQPSYIHKNILDFYKYGQPIIDPMEVENFVQSLSLKDIVETANKIYVEDNLYEFVLKN